VSFLGGDVQQNFIYFDKMSSTPQQDGRSGVWTLRAFVGSDYNASAIKTQHDLIVTADVTAKVGFHNPPRTLQAGLPLNPSGSLSTSTLRVELQDLNGNPTLAASSVTVSLTAYRVASSSFDAYGFSASSSITSPPPPTSPGFIASTTSVIIPMNSWQTTFYYLDTTASNNYTLPVSSPLIAAWVNGQSWSTGTQNRDHLAERHL